MKLLINTSNLSVGGGVQVALSFINELKKFNLDNEYHIFLSTAIDKQINKSIFSEEFNFYLIESSPASFKNRKKIQQKLNTLEKSINPDIVFSVFGPTYWRPKTKHVMGFALPWLINPESSAFKELSFINLLKSRLRQIYNKFYVKRDADYYITETDDTKKRLSSIVKINKDKIFVVGNTVNNVFNMPYKQYLINEKKENEFRFITISHNYPHKNLKIIKDVVNLLSNKNIKFYVTIDQNSYNNLFNGLEESVINLGAVNIADCPSIYEQCDALFLPTLLECFSASYPEAMKMEKPIFTSNYSFATDLCKNAAVYFDPLNPIDIVEKMEKVVKNINIQKELIQNGKKRLNDFETAETRAQKYINIFENIVSKKDSY